MSWFSWRAVYSTCEINIDQIYISFFNSRDLSSVLLVLNTGVNFVKNLKTHKCILTQREHQTQGDGLTRNKVIQTNEWCHAYFNLSAATWKGEKPPSQPPSHSNSSWQDCIWFVAKVLSQEPDTQRYPFLCTVHKIADEHHVLNSEWLRLNWASLGQTSNKWCIYMRSSALDGFN